MMPNTAGCATTSSRSHLDASVLRMPAVTKTRLENGLTVLATEHPGSGIVSVYAVVQVGSASEVPYLGSGISHFVEHMVFKGTKRRPVNAVEREVADLGGESNGHTSLDETAYVITVPRDGARQALDLLADMLFQATFAPEEVEKEREVIRNEMRRGRDAPHRQLHELLWESAFRMHPYGVPTIGHEAVFDRLHREDLVAFYRRYYTPDRIVLSIAGDVHAADALDWVRETFDRVPRGARQDVAAPSEPAQMAERRVARRYTSDVARVAIGYRSVSMTDPDLYALDLLATALGHGESARLVQELQYAQRLVHSIAVASVTPRWPGLWTVVLTTEPERVSVAVEAVGAEIARVQRDGVPEALVARAKQQLISDYLFESETDEGLARRAADGEVMTGDPNFAQIYLRAIERLTGEDLRRVASRYLTSERRTVAVVGPEPLSDQPMTSSAAPVIAAVERVSLPNGAVLIARSDPQVPLVSIRAAFKGGLWAETGWPNGIAALTARLLMRGTTRHTASEIAAWIESLGGRFDAFSGNNSLGMSLDLPAAHAEQGVTVLHELLSEPLWDPDELEGERRRLLAAIRAADDDVFHVAQRHLRCVMYPSHPYGKMAIGTVESVEQIRHDDVVRFADAWLRPEHLVVSLSGALQPATVEHAVALFGGWRPGGAEVVLVTPEAPLVAESQELTFPYDREQAVVLIGLPGLPYADPDKVAMDVLVAMLSGMDGRLFDRVRQQFGLAYVVGASAMQGYDGGLLSAYAATAPADAQRVATLLREELARCASESVPDEELRRVKRRMIGQYRMGLQSHGAKALQAALDELYGLGPTYMDQYPALVDQVNAADVQRAARRCVDPSHAVTVLLIPARQSDAVAP